MSALGRTSWSETGLIGVNVRSGETCLVVCFDVNRSSAAQKLSSLAGGVKSTGSDLHCLIVFSIMIASMVFGPWKMVYTMSISCALASTRSSGSGGDVPLSDMDDGTVQTPNCITKTYENKKGKSKPVSVLIYSA